MEITMWLLNANQDWWLDYRTMFNPIRLMCSVSFSEPKYPRSLSLGWTKIWSRVQLTIYVVKYKYYIQKLRPQCFSNLYQMALSQSSRKYKHMRPYPYRDNPKPTLRQQSVWYHETGWTSSSSSTLWPPSRKTIEREDVVKYYPFANDTAWFQLT